MEALVSCNTSLLLPWLDIHRGLVTLCGFNFPEAIDIRGYQERRQQSLRLCGIYPVFFSFDQLKENFLSIPSMFPPTHLCLPRLSCQGNVLGWLWFTKELKWMPLTDRQRCSLIQGVVPYDFSSEVSHFYFQDQPRWWLSEEREFCGW